MGIVTQAHQVIHPKKIDGSPINVLSLPDGRVFVDPQPVDRTEANGDFLVVVNRGGPDYPKHFCRFEEYGLADGLVRCKKCGKVQLCTLP